MTPPVPAEGRTGEPTEPTPPRRNDLEEISDEVAERARNALFESHLTVAWTSWTDDMRAALAAVLPDDRARVAAEARKEAFAAVLEVAGQQRGEDATARAGLIGRAVQEARTNLAARRLAAEWEGER